MKGKIFKRVASAMLGLMVAFAAIGVNTGFAVDEVDIKDTKLEINVYDFNDDGIAQDDIVRFSMDMTIKPVNAADNGKTVFVDTIAFEFTEAKNLFKSDGAFKPQFMSAGEIGQCLPDSSTGGATSYESNFGIGLSGDNSGKKVKKAFTVGQTYKLGIVGTQWHQAVSDKDKVEIKFKKDKVKILCDDSSGQPVGSADMDNDAKFTEHACDHSDKQNFTPVDENDHKKECPRHGCSFSVIEPHNFSGAQVIAATDDTLGSQYTICSDCFYAKHTKVNRKAGTTPRHLTDGKGGKMNISACTDVRKVSVNIKGYNVIVQDALKEFDGKKLELIATEAPVDSPVRKNIASKISADGIVCTLALNADGAAVKSGDIKDSLRVLYQVPEGTDPSNYAQLLKDVGVKGDFDPQPEKINDKDYIVVWSKTVGPYVLPNGASGAKDPKKKGTQTKTGDAAGMVCLAASGLLVVAGLYMELMKKKKNA